ADNAAAIADVLAHSSASDNCDASITPTAAVTGGTQCDPEITVTATDSCGKSTTKKCTAHVDGTAPSISCPPDQAVNCFSDIPAPDLNAVSASDDCGSAAKSFVGDSYATNGCVITVTRTYKAIDECGNAATCAQTITFQGCDFGDAPAPYPTLLADNGARHVIVPGVYLGAGVDCEADGQPSGDATGDGADEDGVVFAPLVPGGIALVQVTASTSGLLNAWIDFNGDGDWKDTGEQIFTDEPLAPGANIFMVPVPGGASVGCTYARFRFSTASGLSFVGQAPDGEVEDYRLTIVLCQ
ncbi:MAG: hypothetical protein DME25_04625, partial [Verrucomicrobia bacterium]